MVQLVVQTQGVEETPSGIPSVGDNINGGIVFKVTATHVYISSETDLSINYEWGCYGSSISGADGTAIGTGKQNTLDIVAGCSDTDIAAYMCESSVIGGFSDWFLPSNDELSEMYDNKDIIGGFSTNHYWSSTEYFSNFAKVVKFSSGAVSNLSKSSTKPVRPIRSYLISNSIYGTSPTTYLDLGDTSIKATYSGKEIQDITKQKSNFTQNITLPFSETNNDFFSHYYEVNVDGTFRADIKAKCSIYVDSNLQFEGYIQLVNVDNLKENYTALCFGDVANLSTELGEKKLNDLDLSKYNHILSQGNILNSWNGLTDYEGSQADGDEILYPIIDNGLNYRGSTLNTNEGAIKPRDLKPAIKVKTLLDEIVNGAGYTINSTFLNSTFFTKQYMTLGGDSEGSVTDNTGGFKVGMTANQSSSGGDVVIDFDDESSGGGYYDVNGDFNTSTNAYIAPIGGQYGFQIQSVLDDTGSTSQIAFIFLEVNGTISTNSYIEFLTGSGINVYTSGVIELELNSGDSVKVLSSANLSAVFSFKSSATISGVLYDSFVKLVSVPPSVEGGTVDLNSGNALLSKDKQVDFVKSIFSRYNLIVESDKFVTNQLNIEPFQDYLDDGVSKDWTNKLDVSKSVIIEPTNRFRKEELSFSDKEDKDRINEYWQNNKSEIYNSFNFPFYGDFGAGELSVPSMFSSYAPNKVNDSSLFIAQHFEFNDGVAKPVTTKPKLFYYSGLKNVPPTSEFKLYNEPANSYSTRSAYPFCHHYTMAGNTVESTDSDIRFKAANVMSQSSLVTTQTNKDVYNDYWSRSLNNIYNKGARLQTAYFYLNSQDVADFKYNDKIFVKDSYWYINKISSYAIGVDVSTKVELIKVIETLDDSVCNLTYSSANLDGTTNWLDSAGASASPTALCCEGEGLTMVGTECLWNLNQVDETNEPPVVYNEDDDVVVGGDNLKIILGKVTSESQINGIVTKIGEGKPKEGYVLSWDDILKRTEWVAPASSGSGTPAGSNTQVQFNDSGNFGADSSLTFVKGTDTLSTENLTVEGTSTMNAPMTINAGNPNVALTCYSSDADCWVRLKDVATTSSNVLAIGAKSDDFIVRNDEGAFKVVVNNNGTTALNLNQSGDLTILGDITSNNLNVKTQELYVKILPSNFIADDSGKPIGVDDSTSGRWLESSSDNSMFASVEIPLGFKATHVNIYGSDTSVITVYEANINSDAVASKGTGNIGTQINITDVTADSTNYILIQLVQTDGEKVYGGEMTISKI